MEVQKREDEVDFPLNGFNLRPFLSPSASSSDEECLYDLYSVCVHSGSLRLGHYFSYARKRRSTSEERVEVAENESGSEGQEKEQWYFYDDSFTQAVDRTRLFQLETKRGVYILFYVKRKKGDFSFLDITKTEQEGKEKEKEEKGKEKKR